MVDGQIWRGIFTSSGILLEASRSSIVELLERVGMLTVNLADARVSPICLMLLMMLQVLLNLNFLILTCLRI